MSLDNKITNVKNSNIQTDGFYKPDNFEFTPISEMFDKNFDVQSTQDMGEYMKSLNAISPIINDITKPVYLNGGYNTQSKVNLDFDSFEGFKKAFTNPSVFMVKGEMQPYIADPIISGSKSSGYDRIAAHPDFHKLGWTPNIDNEAYYNANTSGWSDFERSWSYWADSVGTGFMSGYRSMADWFDDDSYFKSGDFQSGQEFAEATRMGSSTRGGASGLATNFLLQSGYTVGVLGSIAAEELALAAAATAASSTGVGAPAGIGAFVVGTGRNFVRGMKSIGNAFNVTRAIKTSKSILDTLRTADKAKDFWTIAKTGKLSAQLVGNIFSPELQATLKAFKSGENTVKGLEVLAKGATYGSFYRDVRSINLSMSEAKMEGGLVYSEMFAHNVAKLTEENGGNLPTTEQLSEINEQALKAATSTILFNAPVIYLTNKLVLGTALAGFSPTLRRIFNKSLPGYAKNFIKSKPVRDAATGQVNKELFKNVASKSALGKLSGWNKLKAIGVKGSITGTAHGLLRYSAASIGEGLQEVYQEGVAVGVVDYFSKLLENSTANKTDLQYAAIKSGIKSQMSGQGAEVFMSGFLMGGIVQGPQRVVFETIPEIIQRKRNPEAFNEYKKNLAEFEKVVNDLGDDIQSNPFDYFNNTRLNFFAQQDTQSDAERSLFEADPMGFYDAQDASAWSNRHFLISSGAHELYLEQFEDLKKLSDQELAEAFPQYKEDIESGKGKEKIQKSIDDLQAYVKKYEQSFDLIVNPHNYKQYKATSKKYVQERQKHLAVEHARMLYLFSQDSFEQALKRRDKLDQSLRVSGVLDKLSTDDLTVLLSTDSIEQETKLLIQELSVLDQAAEKDTKLIEQKNNRLLALAGYSATLEKIYDEESDVYDREKAQNLKPALMNYLKTIADERQDFIKEDLVERVVQDLLDHNNLNKRAQLYSRTVSLFSNPDKITDMVDRIGEHLKVVFDNNKTRFENNVAGGVEDAEANQLVSQFTELGVYPDASEVLEFLKTKNIGALKNFYTENGKVFAQTNPELWSKIQDLIKVFSDTKESLAKEKAERQEQNQQPKPATAKEAFDDVDTQEIPDDIRAELDDAPDANILLKDQSPFAQQFLLNMHAKHKLSAFLADNKYMSLAEWINSSQGRAAVKTLEKLKKLWFLSLKNSGLTAEELDANYKNDKGFQDWLLSQKEEPLVARTLMFGGLSFEDVEMDRTGMGLESVVEDDPNLRWIQKGPGINILERRVGDPTSEEDQTILYTLADNNGKQLSDEQLKAAGLTTPNFSSITKATEAYKKALEKTTVNAAYSFDGVDLKYLDEVEDAQGNKFIVLGTSVSTNKGAKLKLLRFEDRELVGQEKEAATFFVNEAGFSDLYTKVQESFEGVTFTENMSKLDPKDMSAVYGRRFGEETSDVAKSRLTKVLSILSPEELGNAQIVILRNNRKDPKKLQFGITPENTFVNVNGDKYQIEIVLDEASTKKVREVLANTALAYPENFAGSIGFITNDQFSFTGVKGKEITISKIEDSKIERYITSEGASAADLKNAALQQSYFIGKVDTLIGESENKVLTMSEFLNETGFDLKLTDGRFETTNTYIPTAELDYNTFDGNQVIMVVTTTKNEKTGVVTKSPNYITNITGTEELNYIKSVENQLRNTPRSGSHSNAYLEALNAGRYVMIMKSPNGAITHAQLRQASLSLEQKTELYKELLEKAQDVATGNVQKKDLYAWNDNFNKKFYIPINKNLSPAFADLKIDLKGDIILRIKVGKSAPTAFISQESITAEQLATFMKDPASVGSLFNRLTDNPAVQEFNKSTPYKLKFSEESLLQVFPLNASVQEIVSKTKTDLDKRVRFGQRAYLTTNADIANAESLVSTSVDDSTVDEYTEFINTGNVSQETLERIADVIQKGEQLTDEKDVAIFNTKTLEVNKIPADKKAKEDLKENTDLQEMDDALYEEFKKNDFINLSSAITRAIANKIVTEGRDSLNQREKDILKVREDIELLVSMASMAQSTPTEELTLDKEIEEAKNNLEKEKALIEAEWARTKRNRRVLKSESALYQAALEKLRALEKKRNDLNAFKLLDPTMSLGEEYSLESFVTWAEENLPDFIAIRDIKDVEARLKAQGIPVGQFTMALKQLGGNLSVEGTIYTGPASSYRYHEAFHAVYRLLLTDEEQTKLRRLAKDEVRKIFKTKEAFDTELSRFRNLHPKYRAMSASELEKEYLEEYMADEFEKFKTNPRSTKTNSAIKSFFNRLLEWIKSVLKGFKGNELTNLFEAIDAGKYKGGAIQDNIFVRSLFDGVTIDAYKIIPYEVVSGERMTSAKYLDPSTANMLIRMIGQTYVSRRETSELSDRLLLETVIDNYADLYNPEQEKYNEKSEKDFEKLENIYDALTMDEGSAVVEAVEQYLDLVNIKIEEQDDEADQIEDEVGSRRVGDYNKDASQFGGFASATRNIRMFIAGVSIDSKDMFGNTELVDGEKIKIPVNHIDVYNGLMLAAMNKTNTGNILKALYIFSRRNEHSGAVVNEFFRRTGIDAETLLETNELPKVVKDSKLFNEFITTFQNARIDYLFHFENESNPKDISIFSASNRDAAASQIDYWKKFFNDKFEIFRVNKQELNKAISNVTALDKALNKKTITNKELSVQSNLLSKQLFESIGIKLSPLYLEISIASSLSGIKKKYQESLVSLGSNKRLLTSEDSNILLQQLSASEIIIEGKKKTEVARPENLFIDDVGMGMSSRLKSIALGNALFDESVGNTVFENPNGDLVYAHQKQTYHTKRISQLNEADVIGDLQDQFETNALLQNPAFRQMSKDNQLSIIRLAGLNSGKKKTSEESSELEEFTQTAGQTYGDFKSVDFIRTLINLYTADYNTKSNKNNLVVGEGKVAATAPILIRIMESSNTGDMISLPIIQTILKGKITQEALDIFTNIVEKEYNIIKDNFEAGLGDIVNYNDTDRGNGFKFFKAQNLLSSELQVSLIEAAKEGKDWNSVSAEVPTNVEDVLIATASEFIGLVQSNRINISSLVEGNFVKSEAADRAMSELNLERDNIEHNLTQIFLNNWINTLAINELILGEEARLFKDTVIDPIKRGKMQNAAHDSVAFDILPAVEIIKEGDETTVINLGINHTLGDESIALMAIEDPKFEQRFTDGAKPGNRSGDKADAQTYITAKGARYFAYGLGQLNSVFAEMLDKIEAGIEITSNDWWNKYKKANAVLNSKKFVYGDGNTFLKMSTVVLTKEETSVKVNGVWEPKPGMEELHYMRENMEAFEKTNEGKVSILAPVSAIKMLKQNIIATERITSAKNNIQQNEVTLLNAKDFGRQLINPSNKLEITEPTQIKSLITSEQYEGDDFKVTIGNEELSMKDVIAEYHKMVSAGVRFDYTQKRNLLFDLLPYIEDNILDEVERSGSIEPNLMLFIRSAQANLKASAAGSNMIEFFKDENGQAKYELNNPITIAKFEQFFLAYFSKKVLAQKTTGMSLALKSDFGKAIIRRVYSLDDNGNIDKQDVIRRKNFEKSGQSVTIDVRSEQGMEELRKALANNPEGILVIDRLRINMSEYKKVSADPKSWVKTNVRYAETIVPAHYKEVMDLIENRNIPIPDAIAKMFIVRIPSQDKHSSMAVRLVDFDPVYNGSTAVFPEELIEISGADFDIDKVYTSIKEWYVSNGEFIEYGTRKGEEAFQDYVHYVNEKVKAKGSYLNDALLKFNESGLPSTAKALDFKQTKELLELGYSSEAIDAMQILNLPKTKAAYDKYVKAKGVEPYKAPIANKIVDLKFVLQGNTKLTESETGVPISYQPADVEALKQEWSQLSEMFPFLKELSKEDGISIDNLIGQYYTHKNVKENANLIGAVVPPNVIFNFLKEQKVALRKEFGSFQIDGVNYNNLVDNEGGLKELRRSQYIISNLISAATDDAKERLLTKLGYVKKAIKAVETMVAFGIPLHTATMLINVKELRDILPSETFNADLKLMISDLINRKVKSAPVTTDAIAEAVEGEVSSEKLLGILLLFNKVNTVVSFADEMISIFRLNNGFGKDFSSLRDRQQNIDNLGLYVSNETFKELKYRRFPIPIDVRKAFGVNVPANQPTPHYIGEYLRINKEFTDLVLPQVFLTQTQSFKQLYEGVLAYTYVPLSRRGSKLKTKIQQNVLAYVTLKAYTKQLFESEAGAAVGASLSNDFIYPSESGFNINKVVTDLRSKYQGRDNYFLDYFLFNKPSSAADNNSGLNTVVTNSFGKLSDNEKVRIQNGFQTLYGERETRVDAMHILHYAMIKDGLQYDYGSILDAITPFGMEKYLQASENAVKAFKGQKSFEEVFGVSLNDLKIELFDNYGQSTSHSNNLGTLNVRSISDDYSSNFMDNGASVVFTKKEGKLDMAFPRFFQIKSEFGGSSYYKLVAATLKNDNVLSATSEVNITADKVTYEKFIPKGSYKQTAIGFMFDSENFSRPSLDKLQTSSVTALTFDDVFGQADPFGQLDEDFGFDTETMAKLEAFNQGPRTATEKGIEIDGVNIAEAQRPTSVEDANKVITQITPQQKQEAQQAYSNYLDSLNKPKGTINVYWGQAESETSTKILSNLAPRKFIWEGREYGSVEHTYQSNKSGTFDKATYDKYVKAGGYGTKIRGKGTVAEMKAADSLGLMKKLVVESFKQNPDSEAAKKLLQYENFTHNTNELIDKAFLEGLKLAQQALLGSKQDIQGFKEFVGGKPSTRMAAFAQGQVAEDIVTEELEDFGEEIQEDLLDDFVSALALDNYTGVDLDALKDAGVDVSSSLSLKNSFKSSKFTTEKEFIEHLKKCYINR